jgi:coenzyme F420-reducing hydrogenase delta subunit
VKAAEVPSATDGQIEAQIRTALHVQDHLVTLSAGACHLVFACEWSGYSAAEIAGAQGLAYPASTRIIRLNCTGRLQPGLILKALEMGAAGVIVLGCAPGLCHYEQGNERCAAAFEQADGLARLLALDHRSAGMISDGGRVCASVADFVWPEGQVRKVKRTNWPHVTWVAMSYRAWEDIRESGVRCGMWRVRPSVPSRDTTAAFRRA